ncbi:MAG: hypothetical protein ABGX27_08330 [Desulfurobacteriaceae bacterium]
MKNKKILLFAFLGITSFLSPAVSFADVEKVCSCNQLGSNYWCGMGDTPDKAKEELAKNIYTFVDSKSSKIINGENGKYTGKFNQNTLISTTAIVGNLETNSCNGTYVTFIRKDKYRKLIESSFKTELTKVDTTNDIDELLKIRRRLSTLYTVASLVGANVGEDKFKDTVTRIDKKIEKIKIEKVESFIKTIRSRIKEDENKLRENRIDYSEFSEEVEDAISQLREKAREFEGCKACERRFDRAISEILSIKEKVFDTLPASIRIIVVEGNGIVFIDGKRKNSIEGEPQEKLHIIKVKGYNGYETRIFKVRSKKGRTITKEIRLWKLDKVFHRRIKLGYRTPYNIFFASYQKFYSLRNPIFKAFVGTSLGYSHDHYGFETETTVGLKVYRRNEEEFLFMVGNNLLSFSLGASLGYYGFNDKENRSYWFLRPFVSTELDFNYYFGIELKGFYQKILSKDDGFKPDRFGVSTSLNFYF